MDVQLQELIDKIKNDGVSSAQKQAAGIIAEAQDKAQGIVAEAKAKADRIVENARQEAAKTERAGRDALEQSARDLLLSVQKRLVALFSSIVERETTEALSAEVVADLIVAVVKGWARDPGAELGVLVSEETLAKVESHLRGRLSEKLESGLRISPSPNVDAGFRVEVDGGSAYYNFTAEEIAEALSEYLNPRIREIMQSAAS